MKLQIKAKHLAHINLSPFYLFISGIKWIG